MLLKASGEVAGKGEWVAGEELKVEEWGDGEMSKDTGFDVSAQPNGTRGSRG